MAGHSQFKNIMYRKGAQDARKARLFNRLSREISCAAQSKGTDPAYNSALRNAIQNARAQNMPRERIEKAIGVSSDKVVYEEVLYEGYGPGGVALIIEAITDNRNRTTSDIRSTLTRHGGTLGASNSVTFLFQRFGMISYPVLVANSDDVWNAVLEAGAEDLEVTETDYEILTTVAEFAQVRAALEASLGPPTQSHLSWKPLSTVSVSDDQAETLTKLFTALEEQDDVQNVESALYASDGD